MKTKTDIYQKITDEIIILLEEVKAGDFQRTWIMIGEEANNPFSKTIYRGINQFYLSYLAYKREYKYNRWLTFKQANNSGGKILKGSKAVEVTYIDFIYKDKDGNRVKGEKVKNYSSPKLKEEGITAIPFILFYYVFNVGQIENLPELYYQSKLDDLIDFDPDDKAELILKESGAVVEHRPQDKACYNYGLDKIFLPLRKQFKDAESFYRTAFHELTHWTGHPSRLNRIDGAAFGSPKYAFEELIAELGSAFLNAHCGFKSQITNSTAYIDSWLSALRNDKKFIFKASAKAQKAVDFLTVQSNASQTVKAA